MWKWCSRLVFALAALAPGLGYAEMATLAGAWSFRAEFRQMDCTITGDAVLTDTPTRDVYDVRLVAIETCGGQANTPVEQRCRAVQTAANVSIDCELAGAGRPGYWPDDFELAVKGPGLMVGVLTANWNQPAIWRRSGGAPVA